MFQVYKKSRYGSHLILAGEFETRCPAVCFADALSFEKDSLFVLLMSAETLITTYCTSENEKLPKAQ